MFTLIAAVGAVLAASGVDSDVLLLESLSVLDIMNSKDKHRG
jgi:hypothetical protein